ncbi:lipopolysaccharide assembly protein LapB [Caldimonas sp.]|uniref:lipopolysaccharide assembly protein LapB n=1 Tax=Caldimonas sp. TaxID=2838790 RepID=UPI0029D82FB3|nr:lipopolysaccharide assembly protein LapB [Caldimonas manganoxidans]
MEFDYQWLLLGLPLAFGLGWLASRLDLRQWRREQQSSPKAYFKGLNLLLNEQQDKAIDAFIEAVQHDPDTTDLHFALGNLFRRRGEYERAVRVHEHLLSRADLPRAERERAQYALAQDFMKAGLFDRAEAAYRALENTAFATEARLALLALYERSRDWPAAIETATKLEAAATGSFAQRIAHYHCELAHEADARGDSAAAEQALARARQAAAHAARPIVMQGERLARQGRHEEALATWGDLMAVQPERFALVAQAYATSAQAAGQVPQALRRLQTLYDQQPSTALLRALLQLDADPAARRRRLAEHLERQASVGAAAGLVEECLHRQDVLSPQELQSMHKVLAATARPLQRYRCAACGFEAQHYFWQCPGCHSWDSYPPRHLDEL